MKISRSNPPLIYFSQNTKLAQNSVLHQALRIEKNNRFVIFPSVL
jgi:hypothetical protein